MFEYMKDETISDRIPHPVKDVFQRLKLRVSETSLENSLGKTTATQKIIQEFRPISQSLEWDLARLHWSKAGLLPFVENSVPFIINNSGRLSELAAAVLFNSCEESHSEKIQLLELGAGTGLFARYFLDAFKSACEQEGRDYYDRLLFYVTDYSPTTIIQWTERDIFAEHSDHVFMGVCDGLKPQTVRGASGSLVKISGLKAIYCNYMLDILPTTMIRPGKNGYEELRIRTQLNANSDIVAQYTPLTLDQLHEIVGSNNTEQLSQLIPLLEVFEYEIKYFPINSTDIPYGKEAIEFGEKLERVLVNYGAIDCIAQCKKLLSIDGFILINDYGPVKPEQLNEWSLSQRFGATVANGLNFPLFDHIFKDDVLAPIECQDVPVQARLISCGKYTSSTRDSFLERFGKDAHDYYEFDLVEARAHRDAGRKDDALKCYKSALAHNLKDWYVIGEIGEYLTVQLQDYIAGVELLQHAILMNPWYSTWLWNVLGDGLFCMEKFTEAHEAYLQAQRIDPNDVRVNLNLAYTYYQDGLYDEALSAIAKGLSHDVRSHYRDRLLEKQQQILAAISGKWLGEQERLVNRNHRLN